MKPLPTLYSRTSTGAIQEWTIEVEGDKYRTTYGQTDGKKITTEWTVAKPTNVGKANERSGEKQAQSEAKSVWKKKKESGYWEDVNDIDKAQFIEPMLAENFKDRKDEIPWAEGVYVQPKLDGNRCIDSVDGMQSRNGKPIVSCPHIHRKLKKVFEKYPQLILDGELYADKFANDFDHLSSIVRKSKPTENDLMESDALMQYWIYDIVDTTKTFEERHEIVKNIFKEFKLDHSFVMVETVKVYSLKEATEHYERWVDAGMEGGMVRLNAFYKHGRGAVLLKWKDFQDREYRIKEIVEGDGNKSGMAGRAILYNDDQSTFKSNFKGNRAFLKKLLAEKDQYVDGIATVKFFNLTPSGVPRFPYIIKIYRKGEDKN